jgi:phosphatidate phosphatase APP1
VSDWSIELDYLARKLGLGAANAVRAIGSAMDDDPFEILCYRGYGNGVQAHVYGRVVRRIGATASSDTDTIVTNLLNTYRRADADPVPMAQLGIEFASAKSAIAADAQGYFGGWLKSAPPYNTSEWHDYRAEMKLVSGGKDPVTGSGEIMIPPKSARLAVISDIDDTVIQSRVSNFIQAARTIMLGNARTRLPFHGVAAFYRALRGGITGEENNPVFYVSSSPWNIYDVIAEFMQLQNIPKGPLLLRDWDLSLRSLKSDRHFEHKGVAIRNVLQLYPDLKFVLIGDTSQHDPEIYRRIVAEFPSRIMAIYIRDVTRNAERTASVKKLADEVVEAGSALVLSEDSMGAARHAVESGFFAEDKLAEIGEEKRADEGSAT